MLLLMLCVRCSDLQSNVSLIKTATCPITIPPLSSYPLPLYVIPHQPGCSGHGCAQPHFAHQNPKTYLWSNTFEEISILQQLHSIGVLL